MRSMEFDNMNEAYHAIYMHVAGNGQRSEHRAGPCIEVRPFSFSLTHPSEGLFTGAARRLNYRFWAAETLCYIAGWGEKQAKRCAELLVCLNSNYVNFARTPEGMDPSCYELMPMVRYGDALGPGLARCYDTLKAKPMSRQAHISIHDRDTLQTHEELPCAGSVQYFCTLDSKGEPRLEALYNIRSNDMNWGMPYDVASNCCIQWTLAGALGFAMGKHHHVAGSMHFYLENDGSACRPPAVSPPHLEDWLSAPPRIPHPTHVQDIRVYQRWAGELLCEMHRHFVLEARPGSRFTPVLKDGWHSSSPWISQWVDIIRWRHPK